MKQTHTSGRGLTLAALAAIATVCTLPVAAADPAAGKKIAESVCAACHGPDGNPPQGVPFPVLAQQTKPYLAVELRAFKDGHRDDPVMSPLAKQLSPDDIKNVSEYFAAQKHRSIAFKADAARAERGKLKAASALCTTCHLPELSGQNEFPRLAGQFPDYTIKQLKDFKAKKRTNDGGIMSGLVQALSEEDIVDLAHYIASLQ